MKFNKLYVTFINVMTLFFVFLFFRTSLFSDDIWLNDGSIVKGIIVNVSTGTVLIKGENWWKEIKIEDIRKITKDTSTNLLNKNEISTLNENIMKIKDAGSRLKEVKYWWLAGLVFGSITLSSNDEGTILTGSVLTLIIFYQAYDKIYQTGKKMEELKLLNQNYSKNISTNLLLSKVSDNLTLYGNLRYRF